MKKSIFTLLFLVSASIFAQNIESPVSNGKNPYIIENTNYKLGFTENYVLPVWEMHTLVPNMLAGGAVAKVSWQTDSRVKGYKISAKDIAGEKLEAVQLYPKSHALNDTTAQESCYFTSNILFMNKQLEESIWANITKSFEELARKAGKATLYAGPIYEIDATKNKFIINNRVLVPSYFYRIILYEDGGKFVCKTYRIPNRIPADYERKCSIEEFAYNLYQLEADTGIDFFDRDIDSNFRQEKLKYLEGRIK